jgi:chromosome segregation ATPase
LFDLITPSNFAFTPAIFLAVGNTLVAPDLETATRWAYDFSKRWRVVTLDGKLIETAGTMAGGGKNVRRGGMRLAVSIVGAAYFDLLWLVHSPLPILSHTEWSIWRRSDPYGR